MSTPTSSVTIYDNNNYTGASQALLLGYNAGPLAIGNDRVSAVRVPAGFRVTLYEHAPDNGRTKVLTADAASLPDFNDITSNILVERTGNQYQTEAQWGGTSAPWHPNGVFTIGGREGQRAVGLWAKSSDEGVTFTGEMQYGKSSTWPDGEGRVGFKARQIKGNLYKTEVQWGGTTAEWHDNGVFVIGGRDGQRCVNIQISSADGGESFTGQMQYGKSRQWPSGEGLIGLRAKRIA